MVTPTNEQKMSERIGKLIRQADGAPEGSPEREAFMERAMTLSQVHSIDMVLARAKAYDKEKVEEPEERKYVVGDRGNRNTPKAKNAHFVDLLLALAEAFDMKPLIGHSNMYVWLMGYPSDHTMVEKMFSMLSVQMVADADRLLRQGVNKSKRYVTRTQRVPIPYEERAWGDLDPKTNRWYIERFTFEWEMESFGLDPLTDEPHPGIEVPHETQEGRYVKPHYPPTSKVVPVLDVHGRPIVEEKVVVDEDARIWRTNFYKGFVFGAARRMKEAREAALKDAGIDVEDASDEKGMVLLDKKEQINDRYEQTMLTRVTKRGGYGGAKVSSHSHRAQSAGQEAAKEATYGDEMVVE